MKPMKNMAAPTTVFHSFVLLFISAKLSLNLRRYTEDRKDRAAGIEAHLKVELPNTGEGGAAKHGVRNTTGFRPRHTPHTRRGKGGQAEKGRRRCTETLKFLI